MSYVTLAEFKAAVEITDTADDADIQRALDAAYDWINHYTGRTFNAVDATASARFFMPYDTNRLEIPDVSSVTELAVDTVGDESFKVIIPPNKYDLYPLYLMPGLGGYTEIRLHPTAPSWFIIGYQARVTAFWGFGATPAAVHQANIMVANRWFTRLSVPFAMLEPAQTGELATLIARDQDVLDLLSPYVTSAGAGRAASATWILV
jgi:gp6-like head-tail connector protein